jgi:hypothetical protein
MEILFNQAIVDLDGKELLDNQQIVNLRKVAINALIAPTKESRELSGEEKLRRWELALRVKDAPDPVVLSPEETTLIRKCIASAYATLVSGQAWKMLT